MRPALSPTRGYEREPQAAAAVKNGLANRFLADHKALLNADSSCRCATRGCWRRLSELAGGDAARLAERLGVAFRTNRLVGPAVPNELLRATGSWPAPTIYLLEAFLLFGSSPSGLSSFLSFNPARRPRLACPVS